MYIIIKERKEREDKTMTDNRRKEINDRIEWLEDMIFSIKMIDRWTEKNFVSFRKYNTELIQLKKELEG